jgi:methionyl aminopeptidase
MHEDPEMPNYGKRGRKLFVEGMVVALEPMINQGTRNINKLKDGWTIFNCRRKPSAHFEHDIALVDGKQNYYLLAYIYQALGIVSNEEDEFSTFSIIILQYPCLNYISVLNEKTFQTRSKYHSTSITYQIYL